VFRKIQDVNVKYGVAGQKVDALAHNVQTPEAMAAHLEEEHPISHELEGLARDLIRLAGQRRDETLAEVVSTNRMNVALIATAALASAVLALVLGYVLSWSIVSPVGELDEHMARIAQGEFEQEIAVTNRDEFQALAGKANQM